jgi:hypothetical protein
VHQPTVHRGMSVVPVIETTSWYPGLLHAAVARDDARIPRVTSHSDPASRRQVQGDVAALAGTIERLAGDLAIGEEPSNFVAVLDAAGPRD